MTTTKAQLKRMSGDQLRALSDTEFFKAMGDGDMYPRYAETRLAEEYRRRSLAIRTSLARRDLIVAAYAHEISGRDPASVAIFDALDAIGEVIPSATPHEIARALRWAHERGVSPKNADDLRLAGYRLAEMEAQSALSFEAMAIA